MEETEQALAEPLETPPTLELESTPDSNDGISDILANALTGQAEPTKEDGGENQEETDNSQKPEEEIQDGQAKPYGDLTYAEKKLLSFKTEDDFKKFMEGNPLLKKNFLMQQDYTRKTSELAEEKRKYEETKSKNEQDRALEEESWGINRPKQEDMQAFKTLWHVYQHGSDRIAQKVASFFQDVSLLAAGKQPVGPLLGNQEEKVDYSGDARIIGLQRQFETYKQEQDRKDRERQAVESSRDQAKVNDLVNSWIDEKSKAGSPIPKDELQKMAEISQYVKVDHKTFTLDDLHELALRKLGKSDKSTMKKIVKQIDHKSRMTPKAPMSRTSSNSRPDGESLDEILNEGIDKLKGE